MKKQLILSIVTLFLLSTILLAQEKTIEKKDTLSSKTNSSKSIDGVTVLNDEINFKNETGNAIITITDEGSNIGSITLPSGAAPSTTTNKLYNEGGTLKFNGAAIGSGSGSIGINDLTDAKWVGGSLFIGEFAGANDDAADNGNTAVGYNSMNSNTSGYDNTAIGYNALRFNTTGQKNTALGQGTLSGNTTGSSNTATGYSSLSSNTTGNNNTATGYNAMQYNETGAENTAIGYSALNRNTIGNSNIAIGNNSLHWNTTGTSNSASGYNALFSNTTGKNNTASGYNSLNANTTGDGNTSDGYQALYSNTIGTKNVGLGTGANYFNQQGSNNTMIGYQAGRGTDVVGTHNKSGNVFIGYQAGFSEGGDNKLYIENSNIASPLIWGDFTTDEVKINGNFHVTGNLTSDGTGLGATKINELTDAVYDGSSIFLGENAGSSDDGANINTSVGKSSMLQNISGEYNTAIGFASLLGNSTGSNNVGLGVGANYYNETGSNNTMLGFQAGRGTDVVAAHNKSGNVFIGYQAGYEETSSNKLYIENTSSPTPLIWGNFSNDKVTIHGKLGISTKLSTSKIDIAGSNGYDQLRLRSSYTPTGSGDTNGEIGDTAWDDNYLYIKTNSGWKRTTLSIF